VILERVNHDLRSNNGGTIYLPPNPSYNNLDIPALHEAATSQKYDLTTKFRFNGKTFVYCQGIVKGSSGEYANAKLIASKGAVSARVMAITYSTAKIGSHDAGIEEVTIEQDGITENEYKYGHMIIGHQGEAGVQNRGIIANTATDAVTGLATFYLDIPLSHPTVHDTTAIEVWKCPYGAVEWGGVDYQYTSVLGIPMVNVAQGLLDGQFVWLQTWGPCWVCPGAAALGASVEERQAVFDTQGQLAAPATTKDDLQIAGFLIEKTKDEYTSTAAYDGEFIMLQLDP